MNNNQKQIFKVSNIIKKEEDENYIDVYISGEVNDDMYENFLNLNDIPVEFHEDMDEIDSIRITFSSEGGSVYSGYDIVNFIKSWNENDSLPFISMVAGSTVYSMGVPILTSGKKIFAYKNSNFMMHEISTGYEGKLSEMRNQTAHLKKLWNDYCEIVNKNCRKDFDCSVYEKEYYFSAETALNMGIIDEII